VREIVEKAVSVTNTTDDLVAVDVVYASFILDHIASQVTLDADVSESLDLFNNDLISITLNDNSVNSTVRFKNYSHVGSGDQTVVPTV
jgi:hypothetical protein